jgi:hypothetical protein
MTKIVTSATTASFDHPDDGESSILVVSIRLKFMLGNHPPWSGSMLAYRARCKCPTSVGTG